MTQLLKVRIIPILLATLILEVCLCAFFNPKLQAEASFPFLTSVPYITVLTHGLADFNGASHWSNTFPVTYEESVKGNKKIQTHFSYDYDSLIHKVSEKAGGADIYWAKAINGTSYNLYNIGGENIALCGNDYYAAVKSDLLKPSQLVNSNNHIILVFEASDGEETNDIVYAEFENVLTSVMNKFMEYHKMIPAINLIGHSRGGITNTQFVNLNSAVVSSMVNIGTPFFGISVDYEIAKFFFGDTPALRDAVNSDLYYNYYDNYRCAAGSTAVAIAAKSTYDYVYASARSDADKQYKGSSVAEAHSLGLLSERSDVMVMFEVQQGIGDRPVENMPGHFTLCDYEFSKYNRVFTDNAPANLKKRSTAMVAAPHNLEARDATIINYILNHIRVNKSTDVIKPNWG